MTSRPAPDALRSGGTPPRRSALTLAVGEVAVTALFCGLATLAAIYSGVEITPPWQAALLVVCGWVYVAAGTIAWLRRPSSRIGLLMTVGGFAWLAAALANTEVPALVATGLVVRTLPIAVLVHLLLAFPSGRLHSVVAGATVLSGYVVCLVLQAPLYLFAGSGPLSVADRPGLVAAGEWVQRGAGSLVVIAASWLLVVRLRAAPPAQRRLLAALSAYGIVAVLVFPLGPTMAELLGVDGLLVFVIEIALTALAPVAFLVVALRGGFARTGEIEELGVWLGTDDRGRPQLTDVLAAALGDRSVDLLFRVPGERGWVNGAGVAAVPPAAGAGRGVVEVELAGETIGAIVYDATLTTRSHEVRAAARVVALALDRERLTVELRASRARLVEAGDAERRRIARDLHDGLQSRLLLLAVQASMMAATAGAGARSVASLRAAIDVELSALRTEIETAIDELRALVHGVMPAELADGGLPAAIEALADRLPIAVAIDFDGVGRRLPAAVETTGYFVVSEALVNAVKHARASELAVALSRVPDERLRIEVRDDGIGGAGRGHGIRSMADRVEALGGSLWIESETGAGTRVLVELPCAS
ncbi:MAG TPA: ATP-binding protein [Conexibacter sp.]|jgi:signal transduction histidine kinase